MTATTRVSILLLIPVSAGLVRVKWQGGCG